MPPDIRPIPAASAAIFRDGEILIARRAKSVAQNVWSLPGGHIEPGETAREAARRELHEETAITAEILGLVDVNDVVIRNAAGFLTAHYVISVFFGRWTAGEPVAGDDCLEARFVQPGAVAQFTTTKDLTAFIARAQQCLVDFDRH